MGHKQAGHFKIIGKNSNRPVSFPERSYLSSFSHHN